MKQYFNKQFISNMSHELRSPLNSILSLSRVLSLQSPDRLDSEEKEYLKIIERNGTRLLQLINDLVEVAQIETSIIDINPTSLSAVTIVEDERFLITVTDTGIGINQQEKSQLFEGYHQGDATLAGKYPGTGLGLTIVSWPAGTGAPPGFSDIPKKISRDVPSVCFLPHTSLMSFRSW